MTKEKENRLLEQAKLRGLISQYDIDEALQILADADTKEFDNQEWISILAALIQKGKLSESDILVLEEEIDTAGNDVETSEYKRELSGTKIIPSGDKQFPASSDISAERLPPGIKKQFGKYEIIELLGSGGMGEVYKAYDPRLKRYVAIKFLKRDEPDQLKRFLREASAQAQVEHEHICKVYEVGEVESKHYITMQYIKGKSLDQAAKELSLEQKIKVIQEVAEALHEAHRTGLIHRDIKPKNIMVERTEKGTWVPYILDFGLAKEQKEASITGTGSMVGSPLYMSPEQVSGEVQQLDRRTDVYSTGATLYEILAGRPVFPGKTNSDVFLQIITQEPIPLRKISHSIPVDIETIVMKCLEKQPEQRYDSARALADDLKHYLDGEPIAARPASWIYRIAKKAKKNKRTLSLTVIASVIVITIMIMWLYSWRKGKEELRIAMEYNQEIRYIEEMMRHAYTAPLHDVRAERKIVLDRLDKIMESMQTKGDLAVGPANYALGRGYLILRNYDKSKKYLENAWQSNYRTSEMAFAMGQLGSNLYKEKRNEAEQISDKQDRELSIREAEQRRIESLNYLIHARNVKAESPEFVEALIAYQGKNYDAALKKVQIAYQQISWLYEARKLEGDIYIELGQSKQDKGFYNEATMFYDKAEHSYNSAIEVGRSDPGNYEGLCDLWKRKMQMNVMERGSTDPAQYLEKGIEACSNGALADPEYFPIVKLKAILYYRMAEYEQFHSKDPSDYVNKALENLTAMLNIRHNDTSAYSLIALVHAKQAVYEWEQGRNPQSSIAKSLQACDNALNLKPNDALAHNSKGTAFMFLANYEMDSGKDPSKNLQNAVQEFQKASNINPADFYSFNYLGRAFALQASYEIDHSIDPKINYQKALASYHKALEIKPASAMTYTNIGSVHHLQAIYDLQHGEDPHLDITYALDAYKRALEYNPHFAEIYYNTGFVLCSQAKYELLHGMDPRISFHNAQIEFQKAISADPNYAAYYYGIASLYEMIAEYELQNGLNPQSNIQNSLKMSQKAIALNPNLLIAYFNQIYIYNIQCTYMKEMGENAQPVLQKAIDVYRTVDRMDPTDKFLMLCAGSTFLLKADYELQHELDPNKSLKEGEALIQQAISIDPLDTEAYLIQAQLFLINARLKMKSKQSPSVSFENAQKSLEQFISINAKNADAYQVFAEIYRWKAEWQNSQQLSAQDAVAQGHSMAQKAIAINPNHSKAHAIQGVLYLLEAVQEKDASLKSVLLKHAHASLTKGISINRNLTKGYQSYIKQIEKNK